MKKYVRKIDKRTRYTYSVVLPKEIIDSFHWQDEQKVVISKYGKNKIIIADWQPKKSKKK